MGSPYLAIWLTRRNRVQGIGSVEPVLVLKGLLKARLRVEHAYYRMMDDIQGFKQLSSVLLQQQLCVRSPPNWSADGSAHGGGVSTINVLRLRLVAGTRHRAGPGPGQGPLSPGGGLSRPSRGQPLLWGRS
ncbi:unnamed protein product [Boreogadus saida]